MYKALLLVTTPVATIFLSVNVTGISCTVEVVCKVSPSVKVNLLLIESALSSNSTIAAPPSENEVAEEIIAVASEDLPLIVVPTISDTGISVRGAALIIVLLPHLPSDAFIINLFGYIISAVSSRSIRMKIL